MAKIIDWDLLDVGTELTITQASLTFTLNVAGDLIAKDWVTMQALYSKFVKLWDTDATLKMYAFPMEYSLTMVANQPKGAYKFVKWWKPANDATRKMLRDWWWEERSVADVLNRVYVGVVSRGDVNTWAQLYYQTESTGSPTNFTYTDEINEAVQVYWDASNGNFDTRTFFKAFVREYWYKYDSSVLWDTWVTGTWPYIIDMLLSNEADSKIVADDTDVSTLAPYTWIDVEYFGTDQNRTIGWVSYPFRIIVDWNGATLEQIYTKLQYLLRQNSDIDAWAWTVTGKTADVLLTMVWDSGITWTGVYIDNYQANDANRITFTDKNWVARNNPYTSSLSLTFDSLLTAWWTGNYTMYFVNLPGSNDYLTDNAVIVNDASWNPISWVITWSPISKTFDYDNNAQWGRTPWTDADVIIVSRNTGSSQVRTTLHTITRSTWQTIANQWVSDPVFTA